MDLVQEMQLAFAGSASAMARQPSESLVEWVERVMRWLFDLVPGAGKTQEDFKMYASWAVKRLATDIPVGVISAVTAYDKEFCMAYCGDCVSQTQQLVEQEMSVAVAVRAAAMLYPDGTVRSLVKD